MDERITLPPKYYHDNFQYLLNFVIEKYSDILETKEWHFLRRYYSLSEDAQCLFLRFCNRKGQFFKTEGLKYEELDDINSLLIELYNKGFIENLEVENHKDHFRDILLVLNKADIGQIFNKKNKKKEDLLQEITYEYSPESVIQKVSLQIPIIKVSFEYEVAFMKFLFFGNRIMDMTEFVLRDMGMIQYYKHDDDDFVARFENRKEAEDKWMISDQYIIFEEIKSSLPIVEIKEWYLNLRDFCVNISEIAKPSFFKLSLRIAKFFEQHKSYEYALEVYSRVDITPSRERMARCLVKLKLEDEAKQVCREIIENPLNTDELYFAEYFLENLNSKKTRTKKQTTEWLYLSEEITVSKSFKGQVEAGAAEYYMEKGYSATFSENFSFRAIFGLWLWDIIFDPTLVAFHHPFQRRPSDLYLPDFYQKRKEQVKARLEMFLDKNDLLVYLRETYNKNEGTANPFVIWLEEVWKMVTVLVLGIELEALKKILLKIAENISENARGFPDLLIWNENSYGLVEIKGPNDNLSHQQLFWLKYFQELGVNAKVVKLKFDV